MTGGPDIALFIGPANYAAQGYRWARAAERAGVVARAENFQLANTNVFGFPADREADTAVYGFDKSWQRRQLRHLTEDFTHVLFEAFRPLLGKAFRLDPFAEAEELVRRGLHVGMMAHGSEVRVPSRHAEAHAFSPFRGKAFEDLAPLERIARRNVTLAGTFPGPLFASTPDLLDWLPGAAWCPVVVDIDRWRDQPTELDRPRPVVAHIPSRSELKGTAAVRAAVEPLERSRAIEYRELSGVPSAQMPGVIRQADIVLDQFAVGSYGVAAVEAMAAGRVVVGNVTPSVRARVAELGGTLPILQAEPGSLGETLEELLADRARGAELALAGQRFAARVHGGEASASTLAASFLRGGAT
jgi:hypothetical protein